MPKFCPSLLFVFLLLNHLLGKGQAVSSREYIVNQPIIAGQNTDVLEIKRIVCKKDSTWLELDFTCFEPEGLFVNPADSANAFRLKYKDKFLPLLSTRSVPESRHLNCQDGQVSYQFALGFAGIDYDKIKYVDLCAFFPEKPILFEGILLCTAKEAEKNAQDGDTLAQISLARYFQRTTNYPKAEFFFELYLKKLNRLYGSKDVRYLSVTQEIIKLYLLRMELEKAESLCTSLMQGLYSAHPSLPEFHSILGDIYQTKGAHHEAILEYMKYLQLLEKKGVVKSSVYSATTNLIQYSYGQLPNQDTLAAKPLLVGIAINKKQLVQGVVLMKIFAVGADQMIISQNPDFVDTDWRPYTIKEIVPLEIGTERLFIKFRFGTAMSETVEINL